MRKKGLIFIFIVSALYWGYYYILKPREGRGMKVMTMTEKKARERHDANLNMLVMYVGLFYRNEKRFPRNLDELIEKEYLAELPDHGYRKWKYDPETGSIE